MISREALFGGDRARRFLAAVILLSMLGLPRQAAAVPSFAVQTGQPCAACHVGAFGPQLTEYGREFKLYGYVSVDKNTHFPPIAMTGQSSFTKTEAKQEPPPRWFGSNDNFAVPQELVLYYAGRITSEMGAFVQILYDGTTRNLHLDNSEIRYSHDTDLFGEDFLYGATLNNGATNSDLWNNIGTWAFPYASSRLAPNPSAAARIDGNLSQNVLGAGLYASWNSLIFLEFDAYKGLDQAQRNWLGNAPTLGSDQVTGTPYYWRAALEHGWAKGEHYVELGTFGLTTHIAPMGLRTAGTDYYVDTGLDATYQWFTNPKSVVADYLSAHAVYIHENQVLGASQLTSGTNASNRLDIMRADVSYAIDATYTPTLQYFRSTGSRDLALYGTPYAHPDSAGIRAEFAYVPWGKPDDWRRGNLRLQLQYVNYFKFNGTSSGAHNNNTIFFDVIWAFGLNP